MELSTLADKKHPRTFDFDGSPLTIDVLPHKITPTYRAQLAALAKKAASGEEAENQEEREQDAKMVADLVPSWSAVMMGDDKLLFIIPRFV